MNRKIFFALSIVGLSFAVGCSHIQRGVAAMQSNPYENDQKFRDTGKQVFATNCTGCHGVSGQGDGPESVGANIKVRDFTDPDFDKSLSLLVANVRYGKGSNMPGFNDSLDNYQIWSVASYVKNLPKRK